jgi:Uma2 family endonuclease
VVDWYPNQGEWSEEDYLGLGVARLIEFEDGCLEFLPMPTPQHQLLVQRLFLELNRFVADRRLGTVFLAPLPVRLWTGKYREPDVVYLKPGRLVDLREPPTGADLAIEVLSAGEENRRRDLVTKRSEYATAGIPEYWIVDPDQQVVSVLVLDGPTYRVHAQYAPGDAAESVTLPGFSIDVTELFAAAAL